MEEWRYMYEVLHRSRAKKIWLFIIHCITAPFIMIFFCWRFAIIALVISGVFTLIKWLLSLASVCSNPTWKGFLFVALGIWSLNYIYSVISVIILKYHYLKDPVFEDLNLTTGLSWREYQRFKREKE